MPRLLLAIFLAALVGARAQLPEPVQPVLKEFCVDCHNAKKHKGDLDLEPLLADPKFGENREMWEKAADLLTTREMPPEKKPQPSDEQRQMLLQYIDGALTKLEADAGPNPGKVTLRRLNKEEYRRTVFDLLRVEFQPDDFPNDEVGYGFNNIGDVLSISPMLMEKYLAAAEQIAKKAIVADAVKVPKQRLRGDRFAAVSDMVRPLENHVLGLYREGESSLEADFIRTGEYVLRFRAFGEQAGPEAPKLRVKFDGKDMETFEVPNEKPRPFEVRVKAEAGKHPIAVAYLNNYVDQANPDPKLRGDRNLFVESLEIEGPLDGKPEPTVAAIGPRTWKVPKGAEIVDGKVIVFASEVEAVAEVDFSTKDDYVIRAHAFGEQAGNELPKLMLKLGGQKLGVFEIKATRGAEDVQEVRVSVEAGKQPLAVSFVNDFYDPAHKADRNLMVNAVEVIGPINAISPDLPEGHRRIVTKMPMPGEELKVAREILTPFAARAYRRPASEADVNRLVRFVELSLKNHGSFLEGVQAAVQAALCSPKFLFRWELDSDAVKPGEIRNLTDYEVASRLSYFLWSSMPDDELFALAGKGELLKDGNLEKQVSRMLKDWRAHALVENFGGQWLQIHNIYEVDPDPKTFPNFSAELREDMRRETFAFFDAVMKEDRSIFDFIDADYTFLNERLAAHYGIEGVKGGEFQRVALPKDSPRGGVLAQGAVLLATSMPTRTSPVIRGKWILEQILGTPPPPPPANVPPLDGANVDLNAPLRKRLEQHRENPDCAGCHSKMDPLGFALENFDALGAWRTMDGKNPIDASATLPNGTAFNGPVELKKILHSDKFVRAFAQKMMIFALGRGLERYDKRAVEAVVAKAKAGDNKFSAVTMAIVTSDPFLKRKAEPKVASK